MKNIRIYLYFIFQVLLIILITINTINAQTYKIDSLLNVINSEKNDSLKIKNLLLVSEYYVNESPAKAIYFANKAKNIALILKNDILYAQCMREIGWYYYNLGDYNNSLINFFNALKVYKPTEYKYTSAVLSNIGDVFLVQKNFDKAMQYYIKALKIDEKIKNKKGIAVLLGNIGIVYEEQKDYDNAMIYLFNSLNINQDLLKEAIKKNNKDEILENKREISIKFGNIGNLYISKLDFKNLSKKERDNLSDKSLFYTLKGLEIDYELNRKSGIATKLGNIGILYLKTKNYNVSENYFKKALLISDSIKAIDLMIEWHKNLSRVYEETNQLDKSLKHYKKHIELRDSINNIDNIKKITTLELTYKFNKRIAFEKAKRDNIILLTQAEKRKQKIVIYSIISGLLLVVVFAGFIFRSLRITRKQKNIIEKQKQLVDKKNSMLNQQNEEISTQRDEIEAQRDLVTIQKEHIEEIHKEVTDSINYAKRIQEADLPVSAPARAVLGEHFILFKPKDIVSGDFYWATQITTSGHAPLLIVAVADCTGHGVPGAFMSMLGISFLNEIVRKQEVTQANRVLNELRKEVINALQQKGKTGEQKDGMDISMLVVNTATNECQWAGANNPLYIVSSTQSAVGSRQSAVSIGTEDCGLKTEDCGLIEIKGDKMPIAIYERMDEFTNHEIQLQKSDTIYLMSDGYEDQFGGPHNKKFKSKQLKELLLSNCTQPMSEQKEILEKAINEWIGTGEQIDDITILGLKV